MSVLNAKYMQDEAAAFAHVESMLWPNGPVCTACGSLDNAYHLKGVRTKPSKKNPAGKERYGLHKCKDCGKQFTVRMGTIFESSHIDLPQWLQAIHLVCSSKKGISANQLHRTLGVTLKTAWFLGHRIREAMRDNDPAVFGNDGGIVESDETFIGKARARRPGARGYAHKNKVLSLVDRDSKKARSIHTNTIEGYFSIFKRGMKGVYQHCSKKHLHRYLAEYEFRYNNRKA